MTLIHSWCSVSDYFCGYKDTFLIFFGYSFAVGEANLTATTCCDEFWKLYSFYDHLFCRYMKKSLADCSNSKRHFSFAIFRANGI